MLHRHWHIRYGKAFRYFVMLLNAVAPANGFNPRLVGLHALTRLGPRATPGLRVPLAITNDLIPPFGTAGKIKRSDLTPPQCHVSPQQPSE